MKIKKTIGIAAIVVLCGIAVFSGVVFHHQYQDQKNSAQQFEDLSNVCKAELQEAARRERKEKKGEIENGTSTL